MVHKREPNWVAFFLRLKATSGKEGVFVEGGLVPPGDFTQSSVLWPGLALLREGNFTDYPPGPLYQKGSSKHSKDEDHLSDSGKRGLLPGSLDHIGPGRFKRGGGDLGTQVCAPGVWTNGFRDHWWRRSHSHSVGGSLEKRAFESRRGESRRGHFYYYKREGFSPIFILQREKKTSRSPGVTEEREGIEKKRLSTGGRKTGVKGPIMGKKRVEKGRPAVPNARTRETRSIL